MANAIPGNNRRAFKRLNATTGLNTVTALLPACSYPQGSLSALCRQASRSGDFQSPTFRLAVCKPSLNAKKLPPPAEGQALPAYPPKEGFVFQRKDVQSF
jgi:hypothetical protein